MLVLSIAKKLPCFLVVTRSFASKVEHVKAVTVFLKQLPTCMWCIPGTLPRAGVGMWQDSHEMSTRYNRSVCDVNNTFIDS